MMRMFRNNNYVFSGNYVNDREVDDEILQNNDDRFDIDEYIKRHSDILSEYLKKYIFVRGKKRQSDQCYTTTAIFVLFWVCMYQICVVFCSYIYLTLCFIPFPYNTKTSSYIAIFIFPILLTNTNTCKITNKYANA